jgi:uncharacterized protein (UPF0210 family)
MKIRSITYFDSFNWPLESSQLLRAGNFIQAAKDEFLEEGIEVQTTRLASTPFPAILGKKNIDQTVSFAVSLEEQMDSSGFDYASIGPAIPDIPESYRVIPDVLSNTEKIFSAGIISSPDNGIDLEAITQSAEVIIANSQISGDGFGNLRFAALANVRSGSPFFPAAYQAAGSSPGFAIATEAADLAVMAFSSPTNLESVQDDLIRTIEQEAHKIVSGADRLAASHDLVFMGVDFSLAPFPSAELSIGTAINKLGVHGIGNHGSLAAIGILADALDQAQYPKTGFNGVFLPVLEDTVLASSAAAGSLGLNKLLLYSAVCGTGLDTVPIPGSTTADQLYAVMLDMAVLAQRLDKPLTARLMPIPGKEAGESTDFNFEYFANSKIIAVEAEPLSGNLIEHSKLAIRTRDSYRRMRRTDGNQ